MKGQSDNTNEESQEFILFKAEEERTARKELIQRINLAMGQHAGQAPTTQTKKARSLFFF